MTQVATVEKILNASYAEVSVPRKSACGHDCEECAGCGVSGMSVYAKAKNTIGAEPGQKVVVESDTKNLLGIVGLVYLVPIALFLLGYFASAAIPTEGTRYLIAGVGFLAGLVPAILYDRHIRKLGGLSFTIVRLF
ncbi:MAG: SoxR reducing system RseC family protein [Oscillibacter sp.]|jgi:sigma-E factor negative regulatory protein RseC|nr:SoxR reducing system RseC family protein [Oscillibacter sp.]